jgi:hypothetical protein
MSPTPQITQRESEPMDEQQCVAAQRAKRAFRQPISLLQRRFRPSGPRWNRALNGTGAASSRIAPRFHELDAIAEGVTHVNAVVARERVIGRDHESSGAAGTNDGLEVRHQQARMGLDGGPKIPLHAKMDFDSSIFEPAPPALCQCGRFRPLREAEHIPIEASRELFGSFRHCELHVIDSNDWHSSISSKLDSAPPKSVAEHNSIGSRPHPNAPKFARYVHIISAVASAQ